uniref:Protein kinase domain-containing protein n=1 Tax=viral metagenome TaxID=1070528 RepID=A0A6C0IE06_9ZZZZ
MDTTILRGVTLPTPTFRKVDLSTSLQSMKHYSKLESTIPPMKQIFNIKNESNILFDNEYTIHNIQFTEDNKIKGNCVLKTMFKNNLIDVDSYLKVTHLLDPIHFIKNKYSEEGIKEKLENPWNQAYVETMASYALGKLREQDVSPHFNLFYGAYTSVADKYSYNISDEVESYRMYRWFWNGIENEQITIEVEGDDEVIKAELLSEIMVKPEFCIESSNNDDNDLIEELKGVDLESSKNDLESLDSASLTTVSAKDDSTNSYASNDSDDCNVFLTVKNFPVMMIFTEKNNSTMDDLLENFKEVGAEPDSELWEDKWSAWLFQIIASLTVIQTLFKFTHNDLHTNNIVWSYTEQKFLYYITLNKIIYKIPTYGKIFKIIDFGRSIFSLNEHLFISDDFCEGNDADTQYNFPPLSEKTNEPIVYPNFSFDLTRLSISLIEGLFPEKPRDRLNAKILSKEKGRIVKETISDLYNMLWLWLIDEKGENILFDDNDYERFPDFQLYVHISLHCKNGVPKDQLKQKVFKKYMIKDINIPKDTKLYSLYV